MALRHVTDVTDAKAFFQCKIHNIKVKFEGVPPQQCYIKFTFDDGSNEITFETDKISDCASQIGFSFEKSFKATVKNPRSIENQLFVIEGHSVVDKKKKGLGTAKLDLATLATGPSHYAVLLQVDQINTIVDFDFIMKEVTKPEILLDIVSITTIDGPQIMVADPVVLFVDAYPKKYAPELSDKEQPPLATAKFKPPKIDKKAAPAALSGNFEPLYLPELTISDLEEVWLRIRFEGSGGKASPIGMVPSEVLIPLKYILAIEVNGIRYDVGTLNARIKVAAAPKFVQLSNGGFHHRNGATGSKYPGAIEATIFRMEVPKPESLLPITRIEDEKSPLLGDYVFSSIANGYVIQKAAPSGNIGDPAPVAAAKRDTKPTSNIAVTSSPSVKPSYPSEAKQQTTPVKASTSTSSPSIKSANSSTKSSPAPTPSSTASSSSSNLKPWTPYSPQNGPAPTKTPVLNCSLCGDPITDLSKVLQTKDKTFCVPCAKKLVERKKQLDETNKKINPPSKIDAVSNKPRSSSVSIPTNTPKPVKTTPNPKLASTSSKSSTSVKTSSSKSGSSSSLKGKSEKPSSSSSSSLTPSSSSRTARSSSSSELPLPKSEKKTPTPTKVTPALSGDDFVANLLAEAEKEITKKTTKPTKTAVSKVVSSTRPSSKSVGSKPLDKPTKESSKPKVDPSVSDVLDFLDEGPPVISNNSKDTPPQSSSESEEVSPAAVKSLSLSTDTSEATVFDAIDFLKLEELVSPRGAPAEPGGDSQDRLSAALDFISAMSPRGESPPPASSNEPASGSSSESGSASDSDSASQEDNSVSNVPTALTVTASPIVIIEDPVPVAPPAVKPVASLSGPPAPPIPPAPLPNTAAGPAPPPPPPGGQILVKPRKANEFRQLTQDEIKKELSIHVGNEVKDPTVQARIVDVWMQYFSKKSESPELLGTIVSNYYFLIGPLRLKPQTAEFRVKLWESKLFALIDAKDVAELRKKKVIEITKLETEDLINAEIQGIHRRRQEQKRRDAEKARTQAAANSFGDVMSQLKVKFNDAPEETVDDSELKALQELEAELNS